MSFYAKRFITIALLCVVMVILTGCNMLGSAVLYTKKATAEQNSPLVTFDYSNRFYYSQLTENEKKDYRTLLSSYQKMDTVIYGLDISGSEIVRLNKIILLDCPELFWVVNSGSYYSELENMIFDTGVTYEPVYRYTRQQVRELSDNIAEVCKPLLEKYSHASEYERALAAYDFIISNTEYDFEKAERILSGEEYDPVTDTSQCIVSVFLEQASVCAGYSLAYQYLLSELGVFSVSVLGSVDELETEESYNHQWNLLRLDGEYYCTDITWGEPDYADADVEYAYFCITDREMSVTHTPKDWVEYPDADGIKCNYYHKNGTYLESLDLLSISEIIHDAVSNKLASISIKFANRADYAEFFSYLETGQGQASFLNVILRRISEEYTYFDVSQLAYSVSDTLCIARLHFSYK